MNKKPIFLNIFVILVAVVYAVIVFTGNVFVAKSSVATVPGSYGAEYADKNRLNHVELADSEQVYFEQKYELFDYNVENNGIVLIGYKGVSEELVIPATISDLQVFAIGESFIDSLVETKTIYLPYHVEEIRGDVNEDITICCTEDSLFYQSALGEKETNSDEEKAEVNLQWNFDMIPESTFINHQLGDIPFNYNLNGKEIEIIGYIGEEDVVIIPEKINGYPVTKISMDFLGLANVIVIPETVEEISGVSTRLFYSPVFIVELVFTLIAFVVALITVNVLLPKYNKSMEEYLFTGNQMVAVVLYVLCQTIFGIVTTYFLSVSLLMASVVSLVFIALFALLIKSGSMGRTQAVNVEKKIEEKTSLMKEIKTSVKGIGNNVKEIELAKMLRRLEEEIRYSDAVSRPDLDEIEEMIEIQIIELKDLLHTSEIDVIKEKVNILMKIVQDRNVRCKGGK